MQKHTGQILKPINCRQMSASEMTEVEGGNPGAIISWVITGLSIACDSRWKKRKRKGYPSK